MRKLKICRNLSVNQRLLQRRLLWLTWACRLCLVDWLGELPMQISSSLIWKHNLLRWNKARVRNHGFTCSFPSLFMKRLNWLCSIWHKECQCTANWQWQLFFFCHCGALALSACKAEEEKLRMENEKLKDTVRVLKERLIEAEVNNGG